MAATITIDTPFRAATAGGLTLVFGAYQVINFHHYIVDAVIWKTRKKAVRQNLGVA